MIPPKITEPTQFEQKSADLSHYIIFEDSDLIALNKPAGLLSIPDGYNPTLPNLKKILVEQYGKIWVVHRLDKETSGVIIFSKNAETHRKMNMAFSTRKVKKSYNALVVGVPFWTEKSIAYPLRVNGDRRHRTVLDLEYGKAANTRIIILEKKTNYSFV